MAADGGSTEGGSGFGGDPFAFERADGDRSVRTKLDAMREVKVLRRRLRLKDSSPELDALLEAYAMDVILVIEWYARAVPAKRRKFFIERWVVFAVALGSALGIALVAVRSNGESAAFVAVLIALAIVVLQLLAGASDAKAQWSIFWKASSELKAAMYSFLQKWDFSTGDHDRNEFRTALWQEILNARRIVREEQTAYFGTFRSTQEMISAASTAIDLVRGRGGELLATQRAAAAEAFAPIADAAKQLTEARSRLVDARASLAAAETKLAVMEERLGRDAAATKEAAVALIAAQAEVSRCEKQIELRTPGRV